MTKQTTPEKELAILEAKEVSHRERRTARALLLTEARALTRVRAPVRRATEALVASHALGQDPIAQVRREAPALQGALRREIFQSRVDGRTTGRHRLEVETGHKLFPAIGTAVEDDAFAEVVASSLASAWGSTGLQLLGGDPISVTAKDLEQLLAVMDPKLRRAAATEVARAFNDERDSLFGVALGVGAREGVGGSERIEPAKPGAFKVWSALLDRRTCPRCFAADGEIVEVHHAFTAGEQPLHPLCRCITEFIVVAKPARLEDIAIDYDLFKAELRDVIREGRAGSDRHSLPFASDSLGARRSPVTLSRRFAGEPYALRRAPIATATTPAVVTPRRPAPLPSPPAPPPRLPAPPAPPPGGSGGSGGSGPGGRRPLTFVSALTTKHVAALGADVDGDVFALTKTLFAGRCPDVDSWRRLWEPPAGYSVKFTTFAAEHGILRVAAKLIHDASGLEVADLDRSFRRKGTELVAKHDYFVLSSSHQKKGIGEALTRSAILGYREMGVARIDVDAHMVGRYTWARFGFSWRPDRADAWRAKFEAYLARETGEPAKATSLARAALVGTHQVADVVWKGRDLGKEFLLSKHVGHWEGELRLADGDVGFEVARKRLKF